MSKSERRLVLQEEEAALDHGSVERIAGRRWSEVQAVREAVEESLAAREEEAALDHGSVERIIGPRKPPLPSPS